jgi:hypothetical protein
MRSSRLAILAVTVGAALLGWSTQGVTAVAGNLSQAPAGTLQLHESDHAHDGDSGRGHHGDRGGV